MTEIRTTSSTGGQKGVKLARFDLIPVGPLKKLAEHYGVGAAKYANHQWRQGYEWSKSYAALQRHLTAFWGGEDYDYCPVDEEGCSHVDLDGNLFKAPQYRACFNHTGSHHMQAVAWHAFCLLEFIENHPDHDDRYEAEVPLTDEEANAIADKILADKSGQSTSIQTMTDEAHTFTSGEIYDAITRGEPRPPAAGGMTVSISSAQPGDAMRSACQGLADEEIRRRKRTQDMMNNARNGGGLIR